MTNSASLISRTAEYVKAQLSEAEGGHDWFHIQRVWNNARRIGLRENVNMLVVELAALLHDIADSKFHGGDELVGPNKAKTFLDSEEVDPVITNHVVKIIENVSYKGGKETRTFSSKELNVVQDADRIDALGAIGVARAFNYGGFKNRALYNPSIAPNLNMTKAEYKNSTAPTINHFYEKLLLLKDLMNTETGKMIAQERHDFMVTYLNRFYDEWEGKL